VFTGSLVALVTPFDDDNRVDFTALKRLIDFHVAEGSDGLVIAGTTGEAATLSRNEHVELIFKAVEFAAGRIPVVAGTGSNSTAQTIDLSRDNYGVSSWHAQLVAPYASR
jgi:4-hydroxy-tetrahydrodipicolinate synthase